MTRTLDAMSAGLDAVYKALADRCASRIPLAGQCELPRHHDGTHQAMDGGKLWRWNNEGGVDVIVRSGGAS